MARLFAFLCCRASLAVVGIHWSYSHRHFALEMKTGINESHESDKQWLMVFADTDIDRIVVALKPAAGWSPSVTSVGISFA